jgi:hypothetical protein
MDKGRGTVRYCRFCHFLLSEFQHIPAQRTPVTKRPHIIFLEYPGAIRIAAESESR